MSKDSNVMINELHCIYTHLIKHLKTTRKMKKFENLTNCIDNMLTKLSDYWVFSIDVAQVCMLLDPRQKTDFFQSNGEKKCALEKLANIFKSYKQSVVILTQSTETTKKRLPLF